MNYEAINFGKKFKLFDEQWQPNVIAEMNDYQFKIVKLQGDFIWHDHKNTDETFIVLEGTLRIDFRDGAVHIVGGAADLIRLGGRTKALAGICLAQLGHVESTGNTVRLNVRTMDRDLAQEQKPLIVQSPGMQNVHGSASAYAPHVQPSGSRRLDRQSLG